MARGQGLDVGFGGNELHPFEPRRNHGVDGIAARATDADHANLRALLALSRGVHQKISSSHSRIRPFTFR